MLPPSALTRMAGGSGSNHDHPDIVRDFTLDEGYSAVFLSENYRGFLPYFPPFLKEVSGRFCTIIMLADALA
jgi:hypothetical protein